MRVGIKYFIFSLFAISNTKTEQRLFLAEYLSAIKTKFDMFALVDALSVDVPSVVCVVLKV